jgi:hypothetical protein
VKFLSCLGHLDFASVQVVDALVIVTDVLEGLLYYTLSFLLQAFSFYLGFYLRGSRLSYKCCVLFILICFYSFLSFISPPFKIVLFISDASIEELSVSFEPPASCIDLQASLSHSFGSCFSLSLSCSDSLFASANLGLTLCTQLSHERIKRARRFLEVFLEVIQLKLLLILLP